MALLHTYSSTSCRGRLYRGRLFLGSLWDGKADENPLSLASTAEFIGARRGLSHTQSAISGSVDEESTPAVAILQHVQKIPQGCLQNTKFRAW